jgi:hypothetical protein
VIAPTVEQYKPARPAKLVLEAETFRICEHEDRQQVVCMDRAEAEKIIRNKLKVAGYVKDSNAVIDFYERSGSQVLTK